VKCCSVCSFRYMFLAGEHCDQETLHWVRDRFQVPCLDHWWQTGKDAVASLTKITGCCTLYFEKVSPVIYWLSWVACLDLWGQISNSTWRSNSFNALWLIAIQDRIIPLLLVSFLLSPCWLMLLQKSVHASICSINIVRTGELVRSVRWRNL